MTAQSVCAVVVTYNPRPVFVENIAAISEQAGQVVIVDNGSADGTQHQLSKLETYPHCKIIRNHQNLGIACALNIGLNFALNAGFHWICTFDQDSRVSEGFIQAMLKTYAQAPRPETVAVITPTYVDSESGVAVRLRKSCDGKIQATMTSGSMMPSSAIRKLGLFDERLFIDGVDTEYCLRTRRNGMLILQSPAVLSHSLGRTTYHHIFGLRFGATNHSAERRYYITRNRLRLLMKYPADWPWVWREIKMIFVDTAKIVLVEDHKWRKFRAMASGTTDALRGRLGKQREL